MIEMEKRFVITKSDMVADVLKKGGFTLVSHQGDTWTFLNDGNHSFSKEDKKEVTYSNKLFI